MITCGPLAYDAQLGTFSIDGLPLRLTGLEWRVLSCLALRAEHVVARPDLFSRVYDGDAEVESNSVEVIVARLRRKIGHGMIETVRGPRLPPHRRGRVIRAPRSLGARLLAGSVVLIVGAMLVTGFAMAFALRHFIQAQVDGRLDGQLLAVADALRHTPDGGWRLERVVDGPPFDRPLSGWYWEVLAPGPVLTSRSLAGHDLTVGDLEPAPAPPHRPPPGMGDLPPGPPPEPPAAAQGTGPASEALHVRVRQLVLAGEPVVIAAAAPTAALDGPLRDAMTPVAITLGLLTLLLAGGGLLQVRLGLRPLRLLRAELAEVRGGRAERITGPQPQEVEPLVGDLNDLLDQHAANLERARRHVANLAHSLKTPLATLAVSLGEAGHVTQQRLTPLVGTMDRMIRHHLARARVAALGGPTRTRVPLAPRLADHLAAFGRLYAEKALAFAVAVPDDLVVACEAQDLDEILGNLLDNGCRFARSRLALEAHRAGQRVALTIEDDGPGLSAEACGDVLRAGHRLDETAPGYGFGLPIARELIELYGGSIALGRGALGGLQIAFDLPGAS